MKSIILAFTIGISGSLCAIQGQGINRSTKLISDELKGFILSNISLPSRDFSLSQLPNNSLTIEKIKLLLDQSNDSTYKSLKTKIPWLTIEGWGPQSPMGDKIVVKLDNYYDHLSMTWAGGNYPYYEFFLLWDVETDKLLHIYDGKDDGQPYAFNSTGDKIITASHDGTARIWDTATGELLNTLEGHTGPVISVEFNPTGDKVVTRSWDRTARIWNIETGTLLNTLEGHTDIVLSAVFNPTGDKVVTASGDETARIWDATTGELLHILEPGNQRFVYNSARGRPTVFNPTGDKVVKHKVFERDKSKITTLITTIWDVETGTLLHTLEHTLKGNFKEFNSTGDKIVTEYYGRTKIWDIDTGTLLHTLKGHFKSFSPTGDRIVTQAHQCHPRPYFKIWDMESGQHLHTIKGHFKAFNEIGDQIITVVTDPYEINGCGELKCKGEKEILWELESLFKIEEFLNAEVTLQQATILNAIFEEVMKVAVDGRNRKAFKPEIKIKFDFNKHPHLWKEYVGLPEAIKKVFDPYITQRQESPH